MNQKEPQNLGNHRRFDTAYHKVLAALLLGLAVMAIIGAIRAHNTATFVNLALIAALFIMALKLREYPLRAQDRIIRLEERLRMKALLPAPLTERAMGLKPSQLVALRFASDGELADLVEQALDKDLPNESIKKLIKSWRADHFRV
ncbi:MAG TPA: DUF6526 family protein [Holophagaceae bacterium]|jgi:hypothetical protein|nr:DUF6526 family protein [Holophagaceae bacterium]